MLTIADCEICREIGESQSSFTKYGWPDQDYSMSGPVHRLEILPPGDSSHHIRRCPLCGTCYEYKFSYEFLVGGSEDSEDLTRLTPVQARPYLSAAFYDEITAQLPNWLQHPELLVRYYAAQSLMALALSENNATAMIGLLQQPEPELAFAALRYLALQETPLPFSELVPVLKQLEAAPDQRIAYLAGVALKYSVPK